MGVERYLRDIQVREYSCVGCVDRGRLCVCVHTYVYLHVYGMEIEEENSHKAFKGCFPF